MTHVLALPTPGAVFILQRMGGPIVEIGAGRGVWAATLNAYGVSVIPYDIDPPPEPAIHVLKGDHKRAARTGVATMLAVWPPDGDEIQKWITARSWDNLVIVANHARLVFGDSRDNYELVEELTLPAGDKGMSTLEVYTRRDLVE